MWHDHGLASPRLLHLMAVVIGIAVLGQSERLQGSAAGQLMATPATAREADNDSSDPAISQDGRFIAFSSLARNLPPGNPFPFNAVFLLDRQTCRMILVSTGGPFTADRGDSREASISADGKVIAFDSTWVYGVIDRNVFVRDLRDPQNPKTILVSANRRGLPGNGYSWDPSISPDGRFVAFVSEATDLVPGDHAVVDVFVRDLQRNQTYRISTGLRGREANGKSIQPSMGGYLSARGAYPIAFTSEASNLVPGDEWGAEDVFVGFFRPARPDSIELLRASEAYGGGDADAYSAQPSVSGNGLFVAFTSGATNLLGDESEEGGVFVRDLRGGVSRVTGGPFYGSSPSISADGSLVAYERFVGMSSDIMVFNPGTGSTVRASVPVGTGENNGASIGSRISANGRFVVFSSSASTLIRADNNEHVDVFLRDLAAGRTVRVSEVNPDCTEPETDGHSEQPAISASGLFVAFASAATNLVPDDTNRAQDIFVYEVRTRRVRRVSLAADGSQANGDSAEPAVSEDGRFIAFTSDASNLVADDTNRATDVFVYDRRTGKIERVSVSSDGDQGNGHSHSPSISANGFFVAFTSSGSNLAPGDGNRASDVFVHDRFRHETSLFSERLGGSPNGASYEPAIEAWIVENQFIAVVFASAATNLGADRAAAPLPRLYRAAVEFGVADPSPAIVPRAVPLTETRKGKQANGKSGEPSITRTGGGWGDIAAAFTSSATNLDDWAAVPAGGRNVYVRFPSGDFQLVSRSNRDEDGKRTAGNGESYEPALSGSYRVAFTSAASDLVDGDTNGRRDVFVTKPVVLPPMELVSTRSGGPANGDSYEPSISDDGNHVAFTSGASNLVSGDDNRFLDVFIRDLQTGRTTRISLPWWEAG